MIVVASLICAIVYAVLTGFQLEALVPLVAIPPCRLCTGCDADDVHFEHGTRFSDSCEEGVVVTRLSAIEDAASNLDGPLHRQDWHNYDVISSS